MESSLEKSISVLLDKMEKNEQKHAKLQRNFRVLAFAFIALLGFGVFVNPGIQAVQAGPIQTVEEDAEVFKKMIRDVATILAALNTPENGEALKQVDEIINMTYSALREMEVEKKSIFSAIGNLEKDIESMSYHMSVMTADMHRMSTTATPAMGRMNDMMRYMPMTW